MPEAVAVPPRAGEERGGDGRHRPRLCVAGLVGEIAVHVGARPASTAPRTGPVPGASPVPSPTAVHARAPSYLTEHSVQASLTVFHFPAMADAGLPTTKTVAKIAAKASNKTVRLTRGDLLCPAIPDGSLTARCKPRQQPRNV